jgi:hypothetical protein
MVAASPTTLLAEVRALILETHQTVAQGVDSALVLLYWQINQRIRREKILHALCAKLRWHNPTKRVPV